MMADLPSTFMIGTHSSQLINMLESCRVDGVSDNARPFALVKSAVIGCCRSVGNPGYTRVLTSTGFKFFLPADHENLLVACFDMIRPFLSALPLTTQMSRNDIINNDFLAH